MLEVLETQLPPECHVEKTSIHENSITVSIQREHGEIIRFFLTDHDSARECFAMQLEGVKSCDYLLLYTREESMQDKELFCFIELKGKALQKAVSQILDTHKYFTEFYRIFLENKHHPQPIKAAAIFLKERVPSCKTLIEKERLEKFFDKEHIFMRRNDRDFAQFIRNIYA